jgi:hypothetical protein
MVKSGPSRFSVRYQRARRRPTVTKPKQQVIRRVVQVKPSQKAFQAHRQVIRRVVNYTPPPIVHQRTIIRERHVIERQVGPSREVLIERERIERERQRLARAAEERRLAIERERLDLERQRLEDERRAREEEAARRRAEEEARRRAQEEAAKRARVFEMEQKKEFPWGLALGLGGAAIAVVAIVIATSGKKKK